MLTVRFIHVTIISGFVEKVLLVLYLKQIVRYLRSFNICSVSLEGTDKVFVDSYRIFSIFICSAEIEYDILSLSQSDKYVGSIILIIQNAVTFNIQC